MIILGKYNQDKVEKLSHLKINPEEILEDIKESKNIIFKKINRSIKAELLLGIIIVIVASFLSVTSPPSLSTFNQSYDQSNVNQEVVNGFKFDNDNVFTIIIIILSSTIIVIGIINLRKNLNKIKITNRY